MIFLKNKHEISLLSESCQIVADTLNLIEKKIKPGVKISDLDSFAEKYIFFTIHATLWHDWPFIKPLLHQSCHHATLVLLSAISQAFPI